MLDRHDENTILGYVEGDLSAADQAAFESLLAHDESLRQLVGELKRDRDLLRAVPAEEAPGHLMARVHESIERHMLVAHPIDPPRVLRFPQWARWASALAAMLVLTAALLVQLDPFGWSKPQGTLVVISGLPSPTIPAAPPAPPIALASNTGPGKGTIVLAMAEEARRIKSADSLSANDAFTEAAAGANAARSQTVALDPADPIGFQIELQSASPAATRQLLVAWADANAEDDVEQFKRMEARRMAFGPPDGVRHRAGAADIKTEQKQLANAGEGGRGAGDDEGPLALAPPTRGGKNPPPGAPAKPAATQSMPPAPGPGGIEPASPKTRGEAPRPAPKADAPPTGNDTKVKIATDPGKTDAEGGKPTPTSPATPAAPAPAPVPPPGAIEKAMPAEKGVLEKGVLEKSIAGDTAAKPDPAASGKGATPRPEPPKALADRADHSTDKDHAAKKEGVSPDADEGDTRGAGVLRDADFARKNVAAPKREEVTLLVPADKLDSLVQHIEKRTGQSLVVVRDADGAYLLSPQIANQRALKKAEAFDKAIEAESQATSPAAAGESAKKSVQTDPAGLAEPTPAGPPRVAVAPAAPVDPAPAAPAPIDAKADGQGKDGQAKKEAAEKAPAPRVLVRIVIVEEAK